MMRVVPFLLLLCFSFKPGAKDASLFYVLTSNTKELSALKDRVEIELSHVSENRVYQYISNGSQSITSKGYYDCKSSLKRLFTIAPNQPSYINEINQLNDFISDENVFDVIEVKNSNYGNTSIYLFIPFETIYEFENYLELFLDRFLIANRIIVNNELDSKFKIKVFSNLETPESTIKRFKHYEFITY